MPRSSMPRTLALFLAGSLSLACGSESTPPAEAPKAETARPAKTEPAPVAPEPAPLPDSVQAPSDVLVGEAFQYPDLQGFEKTGMTRLSNASHLEYFRGRGDAEEMRLRYSDLLEENGWNLDISMALENASTILATRGSETLAVRLVQDGENVRATVTLSYPAG